MKEALRLPRPYVLGFKANPKYKWYKPLLAALLTVIFLILFNIPLAIIGVVLDVPGFSLDSTFAVGDNYISNDLADPMQVFLLAASVGVMIPAVWLGTRIVGLGSIGSISSVEGHIRWNRMGKLFAPIFGVTLLLILAQDFVDLFVDGGFAAFENPVFAPAGLVAIAVFIPFQCAAEEYAFRGLIMKALGSWIPSVAIVVILQSVFFALAHGYDVLGNIIILVNGLLLGWLVVKTGGLEVAILVHASNNVIAMWFATIYSSTSPTISTTPEAFVLGVAAEVIVALVAYHQCKRNGYLLAGDPQQSAQL